MRISGSGSYYDPAQHLICLQMLNVFQSSNPLQVFLGQFRNQLEPGDQVNFTAGSPTCPAFLTVQGSTGIVVMVDGLRLASQARYIVDSTPGLFSQNPFTNALPPFFNDPATTIASSLNPTWLILADQVWVLGYSWGGAVGKHVLGQLSISQRATLGLQGYFYGSMRSHGRRWRRSTTRAYWCDLWQQSDPISRFPTNAYEAPLQMGILGIPKSMFWDNIVHPQNGVTPTGDGTLATYAPGMLPLATAELRLVDFILGGSLIGASPHALASYIESVSLPPSIRTLPQPQANVLPEAVNPPPPDNAEVRSAINRGVRQAVVIAAANPAAVLAQVVRAVDPALNLRVHRNVYRGSHVITWQGELLAVTGSKREAKKIVRAANRQLGFK